MKLEEVRKEIIAGALDCRARGVIHGTSGNLSVVDRESGLVAITPSNMDYDILKPEDIPLVRLDTGEWVEGPYKPSIEVIMHLAILRAKPKMNAVVHTHSLFATVMSLCVEELPSVAAASTPYSPTRVASFQIPGTQEMADAAVQAMGEDNVVCLLKHHGLIAAGPSLHVAMSIAEYVEENAQTAYYALLAGHMDAIPHAEYQIMHDRAVKRLGLC